MIGSWITTKKDDKSYHGKVIRSTKDGHWIEVNLKGKRYEQFVSKDDAFQVSATPVTAVAEPVVVDERIAKLGNEDFVLDGWSLDGGETFKIQSLVKNTVTLCSDKDTITVQYNEDITEFKSDARIALFLKRLDWKTDAIAITTEEEDYWLAKPYGKAKKADADISKRSGGEIPVGWMCMPIQWYERGKPLTYELSKTWYQLDLNHAIRVPNIVLENAKKSKLFSMSIEDDNRIKEQIQRQKND